VKAGRKGRRVNFYIPILVLAICVTASAFVILDIYPDDPARSPANAALAQTAYAPDTDQETISNTPAAGYKIPEASAIWTLMIYIDADDSILEAQSINDFIEMASAGSNDDVNIVVQFDRIPGYDASYGDWTDCRRFLVTQGMTPADGNELLNIGEVNMGDPATLVDFVRWSVLSYPADRYALIISGHGKGWEGCCWDETSGNDNMNLTEMRSAFAEINAFLGRPLDMIGFDACLMGMTEVAYEIRDYAGIMVASENAEPSSGWPYDAIVAQLAETPEMDPAQFATYIVDGYYASHATTGYTMAALDLSKIASVVDSVGMLAQSLAAYGGADSDAVRENAGSVMTAIEEAVICERHGARWEGSHGLAIYFPKSLEEFNLGYNAGEVLLANGTAWEEFLHGYFTYESSNPVTEARAATQQYYYKEHVDLYDFCELLVGG